MPLYNYKCNGCGQRIRKLFKVKDAEKLVGVHCDDCEGFWERDPEGPTAQKMERLDNGLMPRAIERHADAERLFKERANKIPE